MPETDARPAPSAEARRLAQEAYETWVNLVSATRRCAGDAWYKERVDEREAEHVIADDALMAYVAGLEAEVERLRGAMDAFWRSVIAYPFSQVCKHLVAANMLNDMERLGFAVTPEVADAVVNARDEEALAHPPIAAQRGRAVEGGDDV